MDETVSSAELYWILYGFDATRIGTKWLTKNELQSLFSAMKHDRERLLYGLLAETGAKLGEVLDLGRPSFVGDLVHFPRRSVPVSPFLKGLVSGCKNGLFSITTRQAQRQLGVIGERAGLAGVTTHLFRTSFAVHWLVAGGTMDDLAQVLGYRDSRGVQRLLQWTPGEQNDFPLMQVIQTNVSRKDR